MCIRDSSKKDLEEAYSQPSLISKIYKEPQWTGGTFPIPGVKKDD